MAGLIAGNGASSKGAYNGEAPGANLVSVKVAGASGVTDLATVISGINWVVSHRDQHGIRVLNISMGAIPAQSTVLNPLDQAVETAWQAGIAVVVSAGNAGPFNGTILSPGDDPLVITVGSLDDLGSTNPSNSVATTFSSVGPTNVDGSGTSFSAAITSGAAALLIQGAAENSGWGDGRVLTSDQVKAQLLGTTLPGPVGNPMVDGQLGSAPGRPVPTRPVPTRPVPTRPVPGGTVPARPARGRIAGGPGAQAACGRADEEGWNRSR